MKAIEFESSLTAEHTLSVPASALEAIPIGQAVRVLILLPESDDDHAWERRTAEEFGRGYADSDAIYSQRSTG